MKRRNVPATKLLGPAGDRPLTDEEVRWLARCLILVMELPDDRMRAIELIALVLKVAFFDSEDPRYRELRQAAEAVREPRSL